MSKFYDFQWQRGSSGRWVELNPILLAGEPGVEEDTGRFKIGDGHTAWTDLPYFLNEEYVAALIDEMIQASGGLSGDPRIGDLSDLTTESQELIVSAINEINMDGVEFTLLYDNAKAG